MTKSKEYAIWALAHTNSERSYGTASKLYEDAYHCEGNQPYSSIKEELLTQSTSVDTEARHRPRLDKSFPTSEADQLRMNCSNVESFSEDISS